MRLAVILLTFALVGAGCAPKTPPRKPMLPSLRIERPANGTTTSRPSIEIVGRTNMPNVNVGGSTVTAADGEFRSEVSLVMGTNSVVISAADGYGTTTQVLRIERFSSQ
jgi:hypothetical protein